MRPDWRIQMHSFCEFNSVLCLSEMPKNNHILTPGLAKSCTPEASNDHSWPNSQIQEAWLAHQAAKLIQAIAKTWLLFHEPPCHLDYV